MVELQVLMPMAGLGTRFRKAGIVLPKPLIPVDGEPMFLRALKSFDGFNGTTTYTFIVRSDTERDFHISDEITERFPGAELVTIDGPTRGPAETALLAEHVIDPDLSIVVIDCDLAFESREFLDSMTEASRVGDPDALLLSFRSSNARYSYAKIDSSNRVLMTAEKRVISENALIGAYFFSKASSMFVAIRSLLAKPLDESCPEYYMSMVCNELIELGGVARMVRGKFDSFGTPEELIRYQGRGRHHFAVDMSS